MKKKIIKNIPNFLTISRIIMTIISFLLLLNKNYKVVIILVIIATITDFLDGYLARKLNAQSVFGAKLDQISDKMFTFLICIGLIMSGNMYLLAILSIEVIFSFLVIYQSYKNKRWQETTKYGKIKTIYIFLTIVIAVFLLEFNWFLFPFIFMWGLTLMLQLYYDYKILEYFDTKGKIK